MPILSFHTSLFLYSPSISPLNSIVPFTSFLNFFSDIYIPSPLRYPLYDFLRSSITLIQRSFTSSYHAVKLYFLVNTFYCNSHSFHVSHGDYFLFCQGNVCILLRLCVAFGHFDISTPRLRERNNLILVWSFNHLKTKCRLLYLRTQSVPRSKHFSSRL